MATRILLTHSVLAVLCASNNAIKAQIGAGAAVHLDASDYVTVNDVPVTEAECIALANQLRTIYEFHRTDYVTVYAHLIADAKNVIAATEDTTLATAITLANELKADYNAHRAQAGVHHNDDAGHAIAAADATDLASLVTLLTELRVDVLAHINAIPADAAPALRPVAL